MYIETSHTTKLFVSISGILAGVWPCGVITLLSELFISESKSQVYGHLHSFLQSAPNTADNLSMCGLRV